MTEANTIIVFHIADIHIRSRQHARIKYAFDQLIEKIKNHPCKNKLLVIAGDVFEHKSQVSQQDLDCFHYLLERLQIPDLQIITIPGNHDYSISSKLDFIKVALTNTSYTNVYHYPNSDVYTHGELDFHVLSPMDQVVPNAESDGLNSTNRFKLALIHEPITGCVLYGSQQQLEGRFTAEQLQAKYDLTLAGDLHKRQRLKPTVAYSGSLVQKNKGEGLLHGGIIWEINPKTKSVKAVPFNLMQKDVYLIINFVDNKMLPFKKDWVKTIQYLEIRFRDTDISHINCKPALAWIKKNYGMPHKWTDLNEIVLFEDSDNNISQSQIDLIKKKTDRTDILEYHKDKLEKYSNVDERVKWNLKKLTWSNLFCFGENNSIDFTKLKQLSSIIGPNGTGKSSILDVLLFALFNYQNRGHTKQSMIREGEPKYSVECEFSVGTKNYTIKKSGDRKKNRTYSLTEHTPGIDNTTIDKDITGSDLTDMYQTIRSLIGNHQDFLNTNMRTQESGSFVEKAKSDQSSEIKSYLNLNILTQIHKDTKRKITNLRKQIKTLTAQVSYSQVKQETIDNLNMQCEDKKTQQEQLEVVIQDLTAKLTEFHLYKTKESTADLPRLQNELEHLPAVNTSSTKDLRQAIEQIISECPEVVKPIHLELQQLRSKIPDYFESQEISELTPQHVIDDLQKPGQQEYQLEADIQKIQVQLDSIPNFNPLKRKLQLTETEMQTLISENTQTELTAVYKMTSPVQPTEPDKPIKPKFLNGNQFKPLYEKLQTDLDKIKQSKEIHIPQKIQADLTWNADCADCTSNKQALINPPSDEESLIERKITAMDTYRQRVYDYRKQFNQYETDLANWKINLENYEQNSRNQILNKAYQTAMDCKNDMEFLNYEAQLEQRAKQSNQLETMIKSKQDLSQARAQKIQMHLKNNQLIQDQLNNLEIHKQNQNRVALLESYLPKREQYLQIMRKLEESQKNEDITARRNYLEITLDQLIKNKQQEIQQSEIHAELKSSQQKLKETNAAINKTQNLLSRYEMDLSLLNQIKDFEKELNLLQDYNKYVVDPKTGIQEALVSKQRTIIENTTNSILQDLTDFTIKFQMDELMIRRNKKLTSAALASGAMKFMIDIALRLTLTNLHPFNPPLLIIDEGFGRLDNNHSINIREFLTQIKNHTKIMFITHIDDLKNIADPIIIKSNSTDVSSVVY